MKLNKKIKPKKAIEEYQDKHGCSLRFLAEKSRTNESYLCNRLKTKKDLGDGTLAKLQLATGIPFFLENYYEG